MRALLGEERRTSGDRIAALARRLTVAGQPDAHQIKRTIRHLENDIQQLDRMLAALARRFPEPVSETG